MVLNYYGDDISEETLYRSGKLPGHKGRWDVKIAPVLIKRGYDVASYWNGGLKAWRLKPVTIRSFNIAYAKAKKMGFTHKIRASLSIIKRLVGQGTPVIAEVDADHFYGGTFGVTHVILIVGYDSNNLIVHDPEKNLGARFRKVPYQLFKRSWERLAGLAGRSMIVIKKAQD